MELQGKVEEERKVAGNLYRWHQRAVEDCRRQTTEIRNLQEQLNNETRKYEQFKGAYWEKVYECENLKEEVGVAQEANFNHECCHKDQLNMLTNSWRPGHKYIDWSMGFRN